MQEENTKTRLLRQRRCIGQRLLQLHDSLWRLRLRLRLWLLWLLLLSASL